MYVPRNVPSDPNAIPAFLQQELLNLQQALIQGVDYRIYKVLHVEPLRLIEGMEVLADGTDWDPGSGAGKYYYLGGVWNFLG